MLGPTPLGFVITRSSPMFADRVRSFPLLPLDGLLWVLKLTFAFTGAVADSKIFCGNIYIALAINLHSNHAVVNLNTHPVAPSM